MEPHSCSIDLQSCTSRNQSSKFKLINIAAAVTGNFRLSGCGRVLAPGAVKVSIKQQGERVFYGGVYRCGLGWLCPDCLERIMRKRAAEALMAENVCKSEGGKVWMLTLTVPHSLRDSLTDVFERLEAAMKKMNNLRSWQRIKRALIGNIRVLEVSYGDRGWNPHYHMLLLLKHEVVPDVSEIKSVWMIALNNSGVLGNIEKSVYLSTKGSFSYYISGFKKIDDNGKVRGQTPHELLLEYQKSGDKQALALFKEYSMAIKGKKRMVWSKDLRNYLDLGNDKTDKELVETSVIAEIDKCAWKVICNTGSRDLVLFAARHGGADAVFKMIAIIRDYYEKSHCGCDNSSYG